jgi:hypothetical protein
MKRPSGSVPRGVGFASLRNAGSDGVHGGRTPTAPTPGQLGSGLVAVVPGAFALETTRSTP